MENPSGQEVYTALRGGHAARLQKLMAKRRGLGWLRLLAFVSTGVTAYFVFSSAGLVGLLPAVAGIALLLYLVSIDVANEAAVRNEETLIGINEDELLALQHNFSFNDDGACFIPNNHAYATDLDLFGKASVYQWLARCRTEQGGRRLADNLLQPLPVPDVLLRQEAVKELAPKTTWRQQWQAFAVQTQITNRTQQRLTAWAAQSAGHFTHPAWRVVVPMYSAVTLCTAVAAVAGYISTTVFSGLFFVYLFVSTVFSRHAVKPHAQLSGAVKEVNAIQKLLAWLEAEKFSAVHLVNVQGSLKAEGGSAAAEIGRLKKILSQLDLRSNVLVFVFFNAFLLWDVRQLMALNNWRRKNNSFLSAWFAAVAETEVLHSLATAHFNNPHWCFPVFSEEPFVVQTENMGHPLVPAAQRIGNDFTLQGKPKIGLITGSNMAGKSTFLRSLGVNAVLAQTGAPVCAASFVLSPVQIVSSMRIADNLAENTSTFYAELKKLRSIIEAVKAKAPVFVLLDEILRGTNSFDRHKGSAALIKQLVKEDAVAVIATHDVALAALEQIHPNALDNYHFDVEVEGEEMRFDYKLKEGICKSLNASILMKKIGIDLE